MIDVLENDPDWADWPLAQLQAQSGVHRLVINPIVYAELSLTFSAFEVLDEALNDMELPELEMSRQAPFLAGKAFVKYRRNGGVKNNMLGDFLSARMQLSVTCRY